MLATLLHRISTGVNQLTTHERPQERGDRTLNDWLDIYCHRHRTGNRRFGVVDWFITIFWWLVLVWMASAIIAFVIETTAAVFN